MMNPNKSKVEMGFISEHISLSVLPVGFQAMDLERFKKIFQAARVGRNYKVHQTGVDDNPDILLVNFDSPGAVREKDELLKKFPLAHWVAVSRGPLPDAPIYHIRGMLMSERVFSVLDRVIIQAVSEVFVPAGLQLDGDDAGNKPKANCVVPRSAEQAKSALADYKPVKLEGYRALVVDDSLAIQKSLELNLATLKEITAIDFADNGEHALEMADSACYDLIFLDIMMPGIDGYETCARLRKRTEYKKTPIIMISGKTSPMDEVKGIMAGATTYLTKPVQSDQFRKLGGRVLAWLAEHKNHWKY